MPICFSPLTATTSTAVQVRTDGAEVAQELDQVFESADTLPSRSEAAAVQPVIGISQRVRMKSKEKEDLGTVGVYDCLQPPSGSQGTTTKTHRMMPLEAKVLPCSSLCLFLSSPFPQQATYWGS